MATTRENGTPLTREHFIDPDHIKTAIDNSETMYIITEDEEKLKEVPLPEAVKHSGLLPVGFAIDFIVDPLTVITAFKKKGVTTLEQVNPEMLAEMKETLNGPDNLKIVPQQLFEEKLASVRAVLEQSSEDSESEDEAT